MENKSGVVSYKGWKCEKKSGKRRKKDIKWTEMGVAVISTEILCCGWSEIWKGASVEPNIESLLAAFRLTWLRTGAEILTLCRPEVIGSLYRNTVCAVQRTEFYLTIINNFKRFYWKANDVSLPMLLAETSRRTV